MTALAVAATPALAVVNPAGAATRPHWDVAAPSRFSPNGDGVKDTLRIRYELPARTRVWLAIGAASSRVTYRRVNLGVQSKGIHEWTWNGRNQSGKVVPDQAYQVRLYDTVPGSQGFATWRASDKVQVDTRFSPTLAAPTFGAPAGSPARVYPRTTVVTDTLPLTAGAWDNKVDFFELVIRNSRGRVVRRADVDERGTGPDGRPSFGTGRTVEWAAVRGGKPLPKGRYTAVARGRDLAGNTGSSRPLKIWVSADPLVWKETTTTVTPDATDFGPCTWSTANGCGDYPPCGTVVPSALYAGGLSYRSKVCDPPRQYGSTASSSHLLEVPEATGVRGLAAVRVAFAGAPTTAGEPDAGTLVVTGRSASPRVVGTTGQSPWVEEPAWGEGLAESDPLPQRDPAALWSFSTTGTDSVDVATFTVDVRYLVIEQ